MIEEYFAHKDIKLRIVNALFIKPMDYQMLEMIIDDKPLISEQYCLLLFTKSD